MAKKTPTKPVEKKSPEVKEKKVEPVVPEKEPEVTEPEVPPVIEEEKASEQPQVEPEPEKPLSPVKKPEEEKKTVSVADNSVLPSTIFNGMEFVIGLSEKLPIGQKIKQGDYELEVHWAQDAHKSELDHRKNAYQTLVTIKSKNDADFAGVFDENAEFELI